MSGFIVKFPVEMDTIVCFSSPLSAVGADEFDSQPEAYICVTCLSEAFLNQDSHFKIGIWGIHAYSPVHVL